MSDEFTPDVLALPVLEYTDFALRWVQGFEWSSFDDAIFHLARAMKGYEGFKADDPAVVHRLLVAVAEKRKIDLELPDSCLEDEDGLVAFCDAWERVRYPVGSDPVEAACGLAGEGCIRTLRQRVGSYSRFLTVAALLQLQARQRRILLPVHKVALHFPCQAVTVSSWIRWAIQDRVLVKTRQHVFRGPGGDGEAAEYLLGLHLWRTALPQIAKLAAVTVYTEDVNWLAMEFERRGVPSPA